MKPFCSESSPAPHLLSGSLATLTRWSTRRSADSTHAVKVPAMLAESSPRPSTASTALLRFKPIDLRHQPHVPLCKILI